MDQHDWLAERFEQHRARLRTMAYRMLGSAPEADDAVREAWPEPVVGREDGIDPEHQTLLADAVGPALLVAPIVGKSPAAALVEINLLMDPEHIDRLDVSIE